MLVIPSTNQIFEDLTDIVDNYIDVLQLESYITKHFKNINLELYSNHIVLIFINHANCKLISISYADSITNDLEINFYKYRS